MITIDGSVGEGGGQVLRTSLGLSLVTGQPFRMVNIRAGREKPGLMRQHLTAVRAAAQVGDAKVIGDAIRSRELVFEPGQVKPGEYEFAVGTAGSATLVLQTVLPALIVAGGPSRLTLRGGTHNPWSPPFDFLVKAFLPLLNRMLCPEQDQAGGRVSAELVRPGFYPAGGGEFRVDVQPLAARGTAACDTAVPAVCSLGVSPKNSPPAPAPKLRPLELLERGEAVSRRARAIVAKLPDHIAQRELKVVERKLGWAEQFLVVEHAKTSIGPGNVLLLEIASEHVTEVFTAFGEFGVPAEAVATKAVDEARDYLAAGVPVGPHLADQLLIPMAMAGGGRFRTVAPTRHTTTNAEVIRLFTDVVITTTRIDPDHGVWEIAAVPKSHTRPY